MRSSRRHTDCWLTLFWCISTVERGGELCQSMQITLCRPLYLQRQNPPSKDRPTSLERQTVPKADRLQKKNAFPPKADAQVKRMTYTCENITFPASLRYAVGNSEYTLFHLLHIRVFLDYTKWQC